jgi:hypothetical protein
MKVHPVGAERFHGDIRIDGQMGRHDESNGRFSQSFERAQKLYILPILYYVLHVYLITNSDFALYNINCLVFTTVM